MTSLMFAVLAASLMIIFALATEVGSWYLREMKMSDAADSAAIAGAVAQAEGYDPSAAATDMTQRNGFEDGTNGVNVQTTPTTPQNANGVAQPVVVVDITQSLSAYITPTYGQSLSISAGAGATIANQNAGCALALQDDLDVQMPLSGPTCLLMSNATDTTAVNFDATLVAAISGNGLSFEGVYTSGGCNNGTAYPSNCPDVENPTTGLSVQNPTGFAAQLVSATHQLPVVNPYTALLDNPSTGVPMPSTFQTIDCSGLSTTLIPAVGLSEAPNSPRANSFYPWPSAGSAPSTDYYACWSASGNLTLNGNVQLLPGTYFIYDTNLTIAATATVGCYDNFSAPVYRHNSDGSIDTIDDGTTGLVSPCIGSGADNGQYVDPQANWTEASSGHQATPALSGVYGVTIIMVGPTPGQIIVQQGATVQLSAPVGNDLARGYPTPVNSTPAIPADATFTNLASVLFYMPPTSSPLQATGGSDSNWVQIQDYNPNSIYAGLLYFPTAYTEFDSAGSQGCALIVGWGVQLGNTNIEPVASAPTLNLGNTSCQSLPVPYGRTASITE